MATTDEIKRFIKEFKEKLRIWNVLFLDDRGKNARTLSELELKPIDRLKVLEKLDVEDYSQGPLKDGIYNGPNMWVFGKIIKRVEVYIKVTLGREGTSALCISFHIAEYEMNYPNKKKL